MLTLADRVHTWGWHRLQAWSVGRHLSADAGLRAAMLAVLHVLAALVLTGLAPMWLLLLAPLMLGVPHVAADIRHLVLSPPRPLPGGLLWTLALPFAAMTVLRIVALLGGPSAVQIELCLGGGAVAVAVLWTDRAVALRLGLTAAVLGLLVPAMLWPRQAALLIGHAHNFVAVGLWAWLAGRHGLGRARWPALIALAAALFLIVSGALDDWWMTSGVLQPAAGLSLTGMVATLAPDLPGPWGLRAVMAFALMQAVHYSMWVWCIPRATRTPEQAEHPSRRWTGWVADFGWIGATVVIIGALALPLSGLFAAPAARGTYLSLVLFHGWLELAIAAHILVLGARPPTSAAPDLAG